MAFGNKRFQAASEANGFAARYRVLLGRHPFVLFGLPFIAVIVAGSFVLTPATAIRYEKHDRKVRQMSQEEALGLKKGARKVDMREEYYVSSRLRLCFFFSFSRQIDSCSWTIIFSSIRRYAGGE